MPTSFTTFFWIKKVFQQCRRKGSWFHFLCFFKNIIGICSILKLWEFDISVCEEGFKFKIQILISLVPIFYFQRSIIICMQHSNVVQWDWLTSVQASGSIIGLMVLSLAFRVSILPRVLTRSMSVVAASLEHKSASLNLHPNNCKIVVCI